MAGGHHRARRPEVDARPPSARRRTLVGNAAAITITNGITAGGSLVLQILAARKLGLVGYGAFALCTSILTTMLSVYTGYVGDALTVMDRHHPRVRGALITSAAIGLAATFLVGMTLVLLLHIGDLRLALVYAGMLVAWLTEETGRRLLIVRLQFWRLVANDATYMVVTLAVLSTALLLGTRLSLLLILTAMFVGCLSAVGLALAQLPRHEYAALRPGIDGTRELADFAVWRSLQTTLRQLQLLGERVLVRYQVSLATVGAVESGRLVIAPLQTVLGGASDFLLSTGAEGERSNRHFGLSSEKAAVVLAAIAITISGAAAALSHPVGALMTGRPQPHLLVLGWGAYTCAWAAALPFLAEMAVRKISFPVFRARLVETLTGLALVAVVLALGGSYVLVPWMLAVPCLANAWYLRAMAVRSRGGAADPTIPTEAIEPSRTR